VTAISTVAGGDDHTGRLAVIGDVAGHLDELRGELVRLGADPSTLRLPPELTVIQVGDLVHRGPDSDGVVALVDHYLTTQPQQWVQLVGNHEAQYLRAPVFDWPETLAGSTGDAIRRWWAEGLMRAAVAVDTPTGRFLITHAGLTRGYWREILDRLVDPSRVAAALNSFIGQHDDVLFAAGHMLGGARRPDPVAGPIWAAAGTELVPSWLGSQLPFSQIHGHTALFDWQQRRFRTAPEVAGLTVVDEEAKHETTALVGGRIVGIDPGHGVEARRPWRAWEADYRT
jgi:hypothetical protein